MSELRGIKMAKKKAHKRSKDKAKKKQVACCCSSKTASQNTSSSVDQACCQGSDHKTQNQGNLDERYRGKLQEAVVDFLYLDLSCCDRCQGADKRVEAAVARCRDVLFACGYDIKFNSVLVNTAKKAKRYQFESSPTIRVNGVDICPSVEENDCVCCSDMSDAAVTCRVFPFNDTYYEVPPTDMIVRGIMEVVLRDQRPVDPAKPYVLPENLKKFYKGVKEKKGKAKAKAKNKNQDKGQESCCCC